MRTVSKSLLLVVLAMLIACTRKNYQVCVYAGMDFKCMHRELSRPDAIGVGGAIAQLGVDVVVKRKGVPAPPSPVHEAPPAVVVNPPTGGTRI